LIDYAAAICSIVTVITSPPSKAAFANYSELEGFLKVSDDALGHHEIRQWHRSLPGCSPPILPEVTFVSWGIALHLSISLETLTYFRFISSPAKP
jgi:hypothetical protein